MPELPDVAVYIEALQERIANVRLEKIRLGSPFLLRTVSPGLDETEGCTVQQLRRIGKRIAIGLDNDVWVVLHLMIAGRLHWRRSGVKVSARGTLAAFDFPGNSLTLTEAGTERRAALYLVRGEEGLSALDPGGLEPLTATPEEFAARLRLENHTLKRALTDPRLLSGIGNAYSDEILHRARLSPVALTAKLPDAAMHLLWEATCSVLNEWIERLRAERNGGFPEGVTAFRPEMAVHGKYGQPCPQCGATVQRIRHKSNETNYCPGCQTAGKLLADRALSRLLGQDWPKTPEEMESRIQDGRHLLKR